MIVPPKDSNPSLPDLILPEEEQVFLEMQLNSFQIESPKERSPIKEQQKQEVKMAEDSSAKLARLLVNIYLIRKVRHQYCKKYKAHRLKQRPVQITPNLIVSFKACWLKSKTAFQEKVNKSQYFFYDNRY